MEQSRSRPPKATRGKTHPEGTEDNHWRETPGRGRKSGIDSKPTQKTRGSKSITLQVQGRSIEEENAGRGRGTDEAAGGRHEGPHRSHEGRDAQSRGTGYICHIQRDRTSPGKKRRTRPPPRGAKRRAGRGRETDEADATKAHKEETPKSQDRTRPEREPRKERRSMQNRTLDTHGWADEWMQKKCRRSPAA